MEPTADHVDHAQPTDQRDDVAQAHALVDAYVGHVRHLQALHAEYEALQHEEMSNEQRREEFRRIRHAEFDVLEEARVARQALLARLRRFQSLLRSGE